jgi:hypothetical protein
MMEQLKIKSYKNEGLESKLKWIIRQRENMKEWEGPICDYRKFKAMVR